MTPKEAQQELVKRGFNPRSAEAWAAREVLCYRDPVTGGVNMEFKPYPQQPAGGLSSVDPMEIGLAILAAMEPREAVPATQAAAAGYPATEEGYRQAKKDLAKAEDDLVDHLYCVNELGDPCIYSTENALREHISRLQDFVWSWEKEHK